MDEKIWKNPETCQALDQSETPFWFWNDRLEDTEILRQLKLMTEAGVTCNMPHGRGMKWGNFTGGYLDEEWMGHIRTVLDYKKEQKEPVWIYDEMDWPAGTCNQTITKEEKYREQYLSFRTVPIRAGEKFRCQLRELSGKPMHLVKPGVDLSPFAFNVSVRDAKTGEKYPTGDFLVFEGMIPGFEFCSGRDAVAILTSIHTDPYENGGRGALNYLSREATRAFLDSTYEKYYETFPEYFGEPLKAFFNDETRMCNAFPWSDEFEKAFEEQKGYALLPVIDSLILPGEEAGRVRCDYYDMVAWLFQNNYLGQIREWCEDHQVAFCAHLLGEETIANQVRFSGDFMRQFRSMTWPGIDHLGKGIGSLNAKYGARAARSYGKENYQVEIFAGCGWDLTFAEYIRMISWMFQQGVQVILNHAFFYSIRDARGDDWPPSQFFQWKEWERMPEGNRMIRRLHYAFSGGRPEVPVLIYHPTESYWFHYIGDELFRHGYSCGPAIRDEKAACIDRETQLLLTELQQENIDFDLIHKDALENYEVRDGKIQNCLNQEEYTVFVIPFGEVLPIEGARLCRKFVEEGGQVLFLEDWPAYTMRKEDDRELSEILAWLKEQPGVHHYGIGEREQYVSVIREKIVQPIEILEGPAKQEILHRCYGPYLADPFVHTGEDVRGVGYSCYRKDGELLVYLVNYNPDPEKLVIRCHSGAKPRIWDPLTGMVTEAEIVSRQGEEYQVSVTLPCNYGLILTCAICS